MTKKTGDILISGASIAGPTLAYWLRRYGFNPTVVERASTPRDGGYAVDFRGAAQIHVLEHMGVLAEIQRMNTNMGAMSFVNSAGKPLAGLEDFDILTGDIEILRGDLSRILYEATRRDAEYIFNDSIAAMSDTDDGVTVTFERGQPRRFDLVVGADGLHSNVRRLAFGEESRFMHNLGYYISVFTTANHLSLDYSGLIYSGVPRRTVAVYSARENTESKVLFFFASSPLDYNIRDREQQQKIIADRFADVGWEVPRLLKTMRDSPDFYFDSISQIRMDRWSHGRIVLVGDAGSSPSPASGMGTGLAVVEAYVLAGELKAAGGDYSAAFAAYEQQTRDFAHKCHKFASAINWFVPQTRSKLWVRNQLFRILPHTPWKNMLNERAAKINAITLKDYVKGYPATLSSPHNSSSRMGKLSPAK